MKDKFKTQVVHRLQEINSCLGVASLLAMLASVGLVLPASVGLTFLADAGVGVENKPAYKDITALATATGLFGLVGTVSAVAVGSLVLSTTNKELEEEKKNRSSNRIIAINFYNSDESLDEDDSEEEEEEENELFGLDYCEEEDEKTNSEGVEYTWRRNVTYTYYVTQIKGHPTLHGLHLCRLSSHCGTKSDFKEEIVSVKLDDYQIQKLTVLFEASYPERENLVGKYFHSRQFLPKEALEEYFRLHNSFYWAKSSGQFRNACLDSCKGCSYLHGANRVVCGMHPFGWEGTDCPDKKLLDGIVLREYENPDIIASLNEGLADVEVFKMDDYIVVKDSYSGRRFQFDFDGFRFSWSDQLSELCSDAHLRRYVNHFKYREIVHEDYSHLDKIRELNQDLYGADVRVDRNRIVVHKCSTGVNYFFKFNGQPIDPYDCDCPRELRYNYDLVSLVNYLRGNRREISPPRISPNLFHPISPPQVSENLVDLI
ncbi:hypothetical protein DP113_32975 (plasmid) [Brasilonema octagenarum UFV-E1]|uniref:Uncharacterized protein n=2 Tax=Brasilonema TaxID=383614 RepID=A0A856MQI6_9CYAN|nr:MULTISPECIES: hypothetical protein [Brasilonema]NMF65721.1 hypothetical protein [Brasilonema octagenarum UFV-OR1]QDL12564.1 hypothetical protein DP114_32875 [Brasilonema sennae CENA114]QDL18958.1 hypothetical protein DP113_32975 [Brasilonema octagenarum UFV-E1]